MTLFHRLAAAFTAFWAALKTDGQKAITFIEAGAHAAKQDVWPFITQTETLIMDTAKLDALRAAQDAKAAKVAIEATAQAALDMAKKDVDDAHTALSAAFADLGADLGLIPTPTDVAV